MEKNSMKWKLIDIRPGRLVCRVPALGWEKDSFQLGVFAKWAYKICHAGSDSRLHMVNLCDGLVHAQLTPRECCVWLNKNNMVQMRRDWLDILNTHLAESVLMLGAAAPVNGAAADHTPVQDVSSMVRDALMTNQVFHTPVALRRRGGQWDEYEQDAITRTREALSILNREGGLSDALVG